MGLNFWMLDFLITNFKESEIRLVIKMGCSVPRDEACHPLIRYDEATYA